MKTNRITVNADDGVVNFYHTNKLISYGLIGDLGIPSIQAMAKKGIKRTNYIEYVRNAVLNMVKANKVPGLEWEDKVAGEKFYSTSIETIVQNRVKEVIDDKAVAVSAHIGKYTTFKDMSLNNASIIVHIMKLNSIVGAKIIMEYKVKSGQLSNPETILYRGIAMDETVGYTAIRLNKFINKL